jgi:hypothetical protein
VKSSRRDSTLLLSTSHPARWTVPSVCPAFDLTWLNSTVEYVTDREL